MGMICIRPYGSGGEAAAIQRTASSRQPPLQFRRRMRRTVYKNVTRQNTASFLSVRAAFIACPKALKSYFSTGLFAIFIHPTTFYCSPFSLDMIIQFLLCTKIIHNHALAIIRMSDYNYTDMICRKDLGVMEYMSCPEAAKKWGISERRVQVLCRENRIPGVSKLGYMWLIPKDAEKPIDGRTKRGKELHHE